MELGTRNITIRLFFFFGGKFWFALTCFVNNSEKSVRFRASLNRLRTPMLCIDRSKAITPVLFIFVCLMCTWVSGLVHLFFYASLFGNFSLAINKGPRGKIHFSPGSPVDSLIQMFYVICLFRLLNWLVRKQSGISQVRLS